MSRNLFAVALAMFIALFTAPLASAGTNKSDEFVTIPVYFITDRNVIANSSGKPEFGTNRQYETICKHDPHVGVALCVVENTKQKSISAPLATLGWTPSKSKDESLADLQVSSDKNYLVTEKAFYANLNKQVSNTSDHEMFVFVPGYMSTLESGLRSAARFAYYCERPVLLYSWPSAGKARVTAYTADEASIEWSQDHFDHLIDRLSELRSQPGNEQFKVRLFAHSMGSRLVLRAVPHLTGNPAFTEVSLVCPDIDDGLFQHYVSKYSGAQGSATVRLYLSHKDKMLAISKKIHGGHARLGQTSLSDKQTTIF